MMKFAICRNWKSTGLSELCGLALVVLFSATGAPCQKPSDDAPSFNIVEYNSAAWKEYKPAGARYSVLLPGLPREQIQSVKTAVGDVAFHTSMLAIIQKDEFVVCAINYTDFPFEVSDPTSVRKILDAARDSLVSENPNRKLIAETETQLGSTIGREIKIEEDNTMQVARLFYVKKRLFQVMVGVKASTSEDALRFQTDVRQKLFSSFKILSE